jgi:hypothetical protein
MTCFLQPTVQVPRNSGSVTTPPTKTGTSIIFFNGNCAICVCRACQNDDCVDALFIYLFLCSFLLPSIAMQSFNVLSNEVDRESHLQKVTAVSLNVLNVIFGWISKFPLFRSLVVYITEQGN